MTLCIQQLLNRAAASAPPFNPTSLAIHRRVYDIQYVTMRHDGLLKPYHDGSIILLNKQRSKVRQLFSCAHELGHTYFRDLGDKFPPPTSIDSLFLERWEEEALCDIAAAALLMPVDAFTQRTATTAPSLDALEQICSLFQVSKQAAARRLIGLCIWDCTLIVWRLTPNAETGILEPRAVWSTSRDHYIPPNIRPPWDARVLESLDHPGASVGPVVSSVKQLGALKPPFRIESRSYTASTDTLSHRYAISLITPILQPQA